MTGATLQTISVIVGLLVSVITVYYLVRSNIREQMRQREAEAAERVSTATAPLMAEVGRKEALIMQLRADAATRDETYRRDLARKDDRITELEDRLYGRDNRGGPR